MKRRRWSGKLAHPIVVRGGRTLKTLADARAYLIALPENHHLGAWRKAALLLLTAAADGAVGIEAVTDLIEFLVQRRK
jgi:hypothetical protein